MMFWSQVWQSPEQLWEESPRWVCWEKSTMTDRHGSVPMCLEMALALPFCPVLPGVDKRGWEDITAAVYTTEWC
jgi:hypothetical protein